MKPFSSLEMEKIIHTVREHPCVWDTSCPQYRLTVNSDKVFQEIASDLGKSPEDVLKCWEAMKLKYSREKRKEKEEMPRSGAAGGVRKKYKTADWELRPYMTFLDKTLGRRPIIEQLEIPPTDPTDNPEDAGQIPSSFGVRSQSVQLQEYQSTSSQTEFGWQNTQSSSYQVPVTSSATVSSRAKQSVVDREEFPASQKKIRADAKTYEDERRMFISKISDVLTTAQTSSNTPSDQPKTVEEKMANSYGEYVKMRFLNWSKEKMIEGFQMLNETIEKIEKIEK